MVGERIINLSYLLTNTNSSTFLDANSTNIYEHINTLYGHRVLDIIRVRIDRNATTQEATTGLISTVGLVEGDNGFNGEFSAPTDLLKFSRIEVKFPDGTHKKCRIYDNALNQYSKYDGDSINNQFIIENPVADITRNSIKIRPLNTGATVVKGIYLEYEKRQVDFTSSTAPTEIESNLQDILAYDLAELEFMMHPESHSNTQIQLFNKKKQEVEQRFLEFYKSNLKGNKTITFNLPRAN